VIERAVALETTECVLPERLPDSLRRPALGLPTPSIGDGFSLDGYLLSVEARLLGEALVQSGGDRAEAARLLGVTPRSLRYLIKKHPAVAQRPANGFLS
jgi:DNA-binding NtrC family response regulator